jgi:aldehyde dehydrogenase (NAD+)
MTVDLRVPVVHLHIGGEARTNGSGGVHQHCELAFGGIGISGFGREGGQEGLFEFLRTQAVGIA